MEGERRWEDGGECCCEEEGDEGSTGDGEGEGDREPAAESAAEAELLSRPGLSGERRRRSSLELALSEPGR